jgi:uncharacterized protein YodC (DUF2158 family)
MDRFSEGDIVQLKSGGPDMTIKKINVDSVLCVWFDKDNVHQKEYFNISSLISAE